jgi:hypothetical protein
VDDLYVYWERSFLGHLFLGISWYGD